MTKKLLLLLALGLCPASSALAVDALTGLTGMYDSKYYEYEVRGQSSASIRLSMSLWEGGATQARIAMEKARLAQSGHLLAEAMTSLAFDGVSAHAQVSRQSKLVELARQNIDDYTDIIAMLRSRVANGLATEGDISLVESRLFRAQATLAEYQSELLAAKANFEMVTGRPAPAALAPAHMPRQTYPSSARALESCSKRNFRLLAETENVRQAQGQEKLAMAGFSPTIGVEAGPRWQVQNTPQDSLNHGVDGFLTFQWNLYEGGATLAATRQAAAQTRQARHGVQSVADELKADILGTWAQYMAADERMRMYKKSMDTSDNARVVFYEQYLLGTKSLLDLLDADNEYFLAASQYTVAHTDRILGAWRLLALGGDILQELNVPLPQPDKKAGR